MAFSFASVRSQFPAFQRNINGKPAIYLDGPAGSQVPLSVAEAVTKVLLHHNANHGGYFATSEECDAIVAEVRKSTAQLLNAPKDTEIVFGANMTTITFALSRALAQQWQQGDEIVVTQLDHDANVSPWVRAAEDRGVTVRRVKIKIPECTLDLDHYHQLLSPRTRLVALGAVSNATGTRNPIKEMIRSAHDVGALAFIDGVHHTPHLSVDVQDWDCDFFVCSAYKFFGPHVGILWGKSEWLESLKPYKVRPAPETSPDRWMTGTQNFAAIAGVGAALDYLADIGLAVIENEQIPYKSLQDPGTAKKSSEQRRDHFLLAFQAIEQEERRLSIAFLQELSKIPAVKIWGITDPGAVGDRVPTFSFTHASHPPTKIAKYLGENGIFCWHGNYYALPLTEALGLEPEGMVRVGALHYNTTSEVEQLVACLHQLT